MRIEVINCDNPGYWYANHIGEDFSVICYYPEDKVFLVREKQGYLNIIHKDNCKIVTEEPLAKGEIV